ncbi:MAG: hypothetical protein ABI768_12990 [Acidobacteriota bacterium]
MTKVGGVAIVAVLGVLGWPASSSACSCISTPSPAQALASAVDVVTGRVMGIALDTDENYVRLAVRVSGVFKGADDGFQTIAAPQGFSGFLVELGSEYLFYVEEMENGRRIVSPCGRSKKLSGAAEDLAALGVPSKPRDTDIQARAREAEAKAKQLKTALAGMDAARTLSEAIRLLANLPGSRALALFRSDSGCGVWGYAYGYASQQLANARALTECQNQRGLQTEKECALVPSDGAKPAGGDLRSCFNVEGPAEK